MFRTTTISLTFEGRMTLLLSVTILPVVLVTFSQTLLFHKYNRSTEHVFSVHCSRPYGARCETKKSLGQHVKNTCSLVDSKTTAQYELVLETAHFTTIEISNAVCQTTASVIGVILTEKNCVPSGFVNPSTKTCYLNSTLQMKC